MSVDSADGTHSEVPDKGWTNPFPSDWPLHDLYEQRISQHRDLIIIIDDMNAERGTGKTIASLNLGNAMDQTDEGLTSSKATIEPERLREFYADEPKRSGLVLEEAEVGASNRQAMSKVNQALREIMSMGRVEEKYVVVNTPSKKFIDKDILRLADVWISMYRKGAGLVHYLQNEPYSEKLLTPKMQTIEFDDVPSDHSVRDIYRELTREKRKRIRGDEGDGFIERSEHKKILEREVRQAEEKRRNDLIRAFATHPEVQQAGVSQRVIGECADLSQQQVSKILREVDD
jgi:hypothetical protein